MHRRTAVAGGQADGADLLTGAHIGAVLDRRGTQVAVDSAPAVAVTDPTCRSVTYRVGVVIVEVLKIPLIVSTPALAVIDPRATTDVLAVMVDVLATPFTVSVPALAVIDPRATMDALAVIVDVLAMPLIVNVPPLAVTDP